MKIWYCALAAHTTLQDISVKKHSTSHITQMNVMSMSTMMKTMMAVAVTAMTAMSMKNPRLLTRQL